MHDDAGPDTPRYRAEAPRLGPILVRHRGPRPYVSLGSNPQAGNPESWCVVPVRRVDGRWQIDLALLPGGPSPRLLYQGGRGDWFTENLPDWAWAGTVKHLAVLLLYPQGKCIDKPAYDPGAFLNALQKTLLPEGWSSTMASEATDAAAPLPIGPELQAQLKAIALAINGMKRCGTSLPPGVLCLNPPRRKDALRLALGSCQYPPGIVNQVPGFESWQRLGQQPLELQADLIVLTGDQVYVDATAGLFDPGLLDDRYRKPYETWLGNRHVRDVLRRIPIVTTLDDHEIDDNWEPVSPECAPAVTARNEAFREEGIKAFLRYQRPPDANGQQPPVDDPLWFDLEHNGIPIFMLDTRSERERRAVIARPAEMMTRRQWYALEDWLLAADLRAPKIVVSPSVLLPRHRRASRAGLAFRKVDSEKNAAALRSDGWDGYPETFYRLLAFIAENNIRGLTFLSGDEHLGLYAAATLDGSDGKPVVVHSIHSPGLNTPYRFANAYRADLLLDEQFRFSDSSGRARDCKVATTVFEGAGFVTVALRKEPQGGWNLRCEFPNACPLQVPLIP